jgi:hypothetical protein
MSSKFLVKTIILTSLVLIISVSQADQAEISCIQNTVILNDAFTFHQWKYLPNQHYYLSAITVPPFSGALHTLTNYLPNNKNPHLHFFDLQVENIPHYGIWQIDCRYYIGNPFLQDLSDGYLHMTTTVNNYDYFCKKHNRFSARCIQHGLFHSN